MMLSCNNTTTGSRRTKRRSMQEGKINASGLSSQRRTLNIISKVYVSVVLARYIKFRYKGEVVSKNNKDN